MYIVFKNLDEWFKKDPDLKKKFQDTYKTIYTIAHDYAIHLNKMAQNKAGKTVKIVISEQLLKQSLIDAFDDLLRLKNYHPTKDPNPIKETAYIVYWLSRHKPIKLMTEEIVLDNNLSEIARARFLFINEEFGIKLLVNSAFTGKNEKAVCAHIHKEAKRQLKYFKHFLLYYLVYRLDSPKSLEAMMLGCTIHPVWDVDPIIWKKPERLEDDF
ncbi:MAG: hypothetical protein J1G06_07040 [Oscillospiraceae bacterium]|nr:hypothetical protein [Oscillospiraceae bacterium]